VKLYRFPYDFMPTHLCDAVLPKAPGDNGTTLQITCKRPAERQENRTRRLKRRADCKTGISLILAGIPTSDTKHPLQQKIQFLSSSLKYG
jgi:hypothetical protein